MKDILPKFKFKDSGVVINAPAAIEKEMVKLGFTTSFGKTKSANTLVFINDNKEYTTFLKNSLNTLSPIAFYGSLIQKALPK